MAALDFDHIPDSPQPTGAGAQTAGPAAPSGDEGLTAPRALNFDAIPDAQAGPAPGEITGPAGENPAYHQATQDTPTGSFIPGNLFEGRGLPGGTTGEKAGAAFTALGAGKIPGALEGVQTLGRGLKAGAQGAPKAAQGVRDAWDTFKTQNPDLVNALGWGILSFGADKVADALDGISPGLGHVARKMNEWYLGAKIFGRYGHGQQPPSGAAPPPPPPPSGGGFSQHTGAAGMGTASPPPGAGAASAKSASPPPPPQQAIPDSPQWSKGVGPGKSSMHARGGSPSHSALSRSIALATHARQRNR